MSRHEVVVTETRIVTTRYLVEAEGREEAERKALKGDVLLACAPLGVDVPVERTVTETTELDEYGSSIERVHAVLEKPDAFTIHARLWGSNGLAPEAEFAVHDFDPKARDGRIGLSPFPDGARIDVPFAAVLGIRIDSESDEDSYRVTDIEYEHDGETAIVDLPDEMEIDVPAGTNGFELDDLLGEAISERTGWCHRGFKFEKIA